MVQKRNEKGQFTKAVTANGKPLDLAAPPAVNPLETLGTGGTAVYGGYVDEQEQDASLRGVTKYTTYSNCLANVAIIAAGVRYFVNLVSKAEWAVEAPADSGEKGEELAEIVSDMMQDMNTPWHRVIRKLSLFKFYGFAVSEWTAKQRPDGHIGMLDVQARPQKTIEQWIVDRTNNVLGVIQRAPQSQTLITIPREKLVYAVDDALDDSPEGLGLFRHIVDSCARLRRYLQLEGYGFEGDMRGIPIARAPLMELQKAVTGGQITQAQADTLIGSLDSFIKNHVKNPSLGVMLDSTPYKQTGENKTPSNTKQWDLSLLEGGNYSLAEIAESITRTNREIARILGVEHLMLGENSAGSRSLSNDKTQAFGLFVDSTLKELREQMQKDWLGPLWELNGWDPALKPTFKIETIAYSDVETLSGMLRDLAGAGVQLDRQDEAVQTMFDQAGLPRLQPLEEIDTDLLLSSEDTQTNVMATLAAKTPIVDNLDDDDGLSVSPDKQSDLEI